MGFRNTGTYMKPTFRKGALAVANPYNLEPTQGPATVAIAGDGTSRNQSSAITHTDNVATYSRTNHGLAVNDWVLIANATEPEYNGWYKILSVPTANTFTYQISGSPSSPSTGTSRIDISVDSSRSYGLELVSSMTDNGTGAYQVNWVNTQADDGYGAVGMALHTTTTPTNLDLSNKTTTAAYIQRADLGATAVDGRFYVEFFGVG